MPHKHHHGFPFFPRPRPRSFLLLLELWGKTSTGAELSLSRVCSECTQEAITSFSDEGIQVNGTDIAAVYPAGVWGPGRPGEGPTRAWQGAPCSAPGVDDVNIFSLLKRSCTSSFADIVYPEDGGCSTMEPLPRHKDYVSGKSNGVGFVSIVYVAYCSSTVLNEFDLYRSTS